MIKSKGNPCFSERKQSTCDNQLNFRVKTLVEDMSDKVRTRFQEVDANSVMSSEVMETNMCASVRV